MKKIENTVIGLILIIIGVIIGLNAFHITNIDLFFDGWWTLFIIVPCFFGLFKDQDKTGNIIGLIVGIYLLLYCQGLINFQFAWKLVVPVIFVLIGFLKILLIKRNLVKIFMIISYIQVEIMMLLLMD